MTGTIEREEDWPMAKKIVPDDIVGLERSVASLSITKKPKLEILVPCEMIITVPKRIPNKKVEIKVVDTRKSSQGAGRKA
ncbi:MAG: hypothetical protein Q8887_02445 [Candidatus Phytoplasma australasiaticum]|nr:hypothetical protein [Candidatus Phytoplasma australasiaticum]